MGVLAIIETLIGLFVVFASTSLLFTILQAFVFSILRERPRHLKKALHFWLEDQHSNFRKDKHSFVDLLYQAYAIKSITFPSQLRLRRRAQNIANIFLNIPILPSTILPDRIADAVLEVLNIWEIGGKFKGKAYEIIDVVNKSFDMYESGASSEEGLPTLPVKAKYVIRQAALKASYEESGSSFSKNVFAFREELKHWFSEQFKYEEIAYNNHSRVISIFMGFVIAVVLNVNVFNVASYAFEGAFTRSVTPEVLAKLVESSFSSLTESGDDGQLNAEDVLSMVDIILLVADEFTYFPIGWHPRITEQQFYRSSQWQFPVVRNLAGWLISGIAISMGGAFWFEQLAKIRDYY